MNLKPFFILILASSIGALSIADSSYENVIRIPLHKTERSVDLVKRSSNSSGNRLRLSNIAFSVYTVPISIAGAKHNLIVDTGSSFTWVDKLTSMQNAQIDHTRLIYKCEYLIGEAETLIFNSHVRLDRYSAKMHLGLAMQTSGLPLKVPGILGLGLGNRVSATSAKLSLSVINALKIKSFSLFLAKEGFKERSWLMLNEVHPDTHHGEFTYEPLSFYPATRWTANGTAMSVGGTQIRFPELKQMMFDSGTTLIYLDKHSADSLAQAVGAAHIPDTMYYSMDCDPAKYSPSIMFKMATGNTYELPPSSYVTRIKDFPGCIFAVSSGAEYLDHFLIGNVFLNNYVTVFDVENNRIGFADASHKCDIYSCYTCAIC